MKYLDLPTLKYRRMRGDMIEVYKIFTGKYDSTVTSWFTRPTRHVERKYDLRSHIDSAYISLAIQFDMRKLKIQLYKENYFSMEQFARFCGFS